jgi:hypothetical protein
LEYFLDLRIALLSWPTSERWASETRTTGGKAMRRMVMPDAFALA